MISDVEVSKIQDEKLAHLMVSIISLSVFPIIAKPIISGVLEKQNIDYKEFLEQRKEFSPGFIMSILKDLGENQNYKPK